MSQFSLSTITTTTTTTTTTTATITTTTTTTHFSTLLLSDFLLFCSFIVSHPLYFSYFVFFSPYLLRLLSFLSPLFITTFLLLLAFLTISHGGLIDNHLAPCKMGFLLSAYHTVLSKLCWKLDDGSAELSILEELEEAFMLVSEMSSSFEVVGEDDPVEPVESKRQAKLLPAHDLQVRKFARFPGFIELPEKLAWNDKSAEEVAEVNCEFNCLKAGEFSSFQDLMTVARDVSFNVEEEDSDESTLTKPELNCLQVVEDTRDAKFKEEHSYRAKENLEDEVPVMECSMTSQEFEECLQGNILLEDSVAKDAQDSSEKSENKAGENRVTEERAKVTVGNNVKDIATVPEKAETPDSNLETCGSMRKAKEWKRTLACKLYEERHNMEGGEGMDLLWETYEADTSKAKTSNKEKKEKAKKKETTHIEEDDEEEEDEELGGQICCLQALKFSTGKMNLGMGRPNLMKISKALKGIGWLHHVGSRHAKRGYN